MGAVYTILAFVVGLLLAVFGFQNTDMVRVRFLGWSTEYAPLGLLILVSALIGAALAALLMLSGRVRDRLELRRRDKRIREIEAGRSPADSTAHGSGASTSRVK